MTLFKILIQTPTNVLSLWAAMYVPRLNNLATNAAQTNG